MTNYAGEIRKPPTINRPRVFLHRGPDGKHTAECAHCDFTYANVVKTDVEYQARLHRDQHRTGRAEVTR